MNTKFIIAAAILFATSLGANAQAGRRTLKDENARINQGTRSGSLTRTERLRLKSEERRLKKEAVRFKTNDGKVGPVEKAKLRRDEKRLDRNIRRQKHDRQVRP
jgi:hypothetical protein